MVRGKMSKPDRRELPGKASVGRVTARPKGIKPEETEPKRSPRTKFMLGQSGKKKGAR